MRNVIRAMGLIFLKETYRKSGKVFEKNNLDLSK